MALIGRSRSQRERLVGQRVPASSAAERLRVPQRDYERTATLPRHAAGRLQHGPAPAAQHAHARPAAVPGHVGRVPAAAAVPRALLRRAAAAGLLPSPPLPVPLQLAHGRLLFPARPSVLPAPAPAPATHAGLGDADRRARRRCRRQPSGRRGPEHEPRQEAPQRRRARTEADAQQRVRILSDLMIRSIYLSIN